MKVVAWGAGYWGQNIIRELGHHCVMVIEPDKEKADAVTKRFNVRVYPQLPDDLVFDGAVIATPPSTHYGLAKPLLQAGKYVLIEKPFTDTVAQAEELALFPRCMAGHQYLWHPEVRQLRDSIWLPYVHHIFTRRTNAGPVRVWRDALWDLAPHDISIIYYLAGLRKPDSVRCTCGGRNSAIIEMTFDWWFSTSYVSWLGAPKVRTVEVVYNEYEAERTVFDDMATALETPPLTLMLLDFLTGTWPEVGSAEVGLDIVRILNDASPIHQNT
jgi:predicted dehydrogenase